MVDFTSGSLPSGATITRSGTGATHIDNTGTLVEDAADVARFTYDPTTLALQGSLNEPLRINSVRNSRFEGGSPGSPGTPPTNMTLSGHGTLTRTLRFFTQNGLSCIGIRFTGTTSTGSMFILPETATSIVAASGQTWTTSMCIGLGAGSLSNVTACVLRLREATVAGAQVLDRTGVFIVPTTADVSKQRTSVTDILTGGVTVERIAPMFRLNWTSGTFIDVEFILAAPQEEFGSGVTSFILPPVGSPAAKTRNADVLSLARANGTYDIDLTRVSGVTHLTGIVVSGGSYIVPNDLSPLRTVLFIVNASSASVDEDDVANGSASRVSVATATLIDEDDNIIISASLISANTLPHIYQSATIISSAIYQYGGPPLPFGTIDADEVGTFPISEGVSSADLGAHEDKGLLLVANPFNPNILIATPGPFPFGTIDGTEAYTFDTQGDFTTIYVATHDASTDGNDIPAYEYVSAAFTGEVQMQLSLFNGADPQQIGNSSIGEIQLIDPAGDLEAYYKYIWEGSLIELKRGIPEAPYATWASAAKFTAAGFTGDLKSKSLLIRPLSWLLETALLHGEIYGGTGGLDGPVALAGKAKPYTVGYVFGITGIGVDPINLVAQVSHTSVTSITNVCDGRGTPLTNIGDYPTYAALIAATLANDNYATCLAKGVYRVGAQAVKGYTCDCQGDADVIGGVPGPTTRGRIVRRIATAFGTIRFNESEQIDYSAFEDFENKQPAPCGWYWDGSNPSLTKADAITEVLAGCCGWWIVRPNGQLSIGQIEDPELYGPTLILEYPGEDTGECRLGEPVITDTLAPRRGTYIGYQRNYTPSTQDQLLPIVSQVDATIYKQDTLYVGGVDLWRSNVYSTSPVVYMMANYRDEVDARAEYQRQDLLFSVPRNRYSIPVVMDPLADVVWQRAQIENLNRFGWGMQKRLLTCGIVTAASSVELHFWGS